MLSWLIVSQSNRAGRLGRWRIGKGVAQILYLVIEHAQLLWLHVGARNQCLGKAAALLAYGAPSLCKSNLHLALVFWVALARRAIRPASSARSRWRASSSR